MQAAAHSPSFAKRAGIPQSVAREFARADKRAGAKNLPQRKARGGKASCNW
jgi:hypothetical protein